MSTYKIQPSQVLIVPGYTNEEILSMSAKTGDTSESAIKNATQSEDKTTTDAKKDAVYSAVGKVVSDSINEKLQKSTTTTSEKDKKNQSQKNVGEHTVTKKTVYTTYQEKTTDKVNESSAATATESTVKIDKPKALLFSPKDVEYTPHRKDFEEFNSADGLILIEKACDQFAELQLSLSVHQAMRIHENGTVELSSDDIRDIDIITSGAPTIWDKETDLGHFMDPADFTDSYIEIRRGFFDRFIGRPLTLVSDLFPIIPVCYITDLSYNINEGEETAEYSITLQEVDNTWG